MCYRALNKAYKDKQAQSQFWTLTIDAHLLSATHYWCMVFGSDKSNPTHWKRLLVSKSDELAFSEGLFRENGLNKETWKQYWKSVTDFRNKYAAHRELEAFKDPVPNFDTALKVAYFYDSWVRRLISPHSLSEPTLDSSARSVSRSAGPLAEKLLEIL